MELRARGNLKRKSTSIWHIDGSVISMYQTAYRIIQHSARIEGGVFDQSGIFENIFSGILQQCITFGLVTGECTVGDGSYMPANVSSYSQIMIQETVTRGMQSYLSALDEELEKEPGFRRIGTSSARPAKPIPIAVPFITARNAD